jgi:hypothetical protein
MTAVAAVIIDNTDNVRRDYRIRNDGANPVMLGASGITFAAGYLLAVGDDLPLRLGQESIWGICDTALTATIQVLSHP